VAGHAPAPSARAAVNTPHRLRATHRAAARHHARWPRAPPAAAGAGRGLRPV